MSEKPWPTTKTVLGAATVVPVDVFFDELAPPLRPEFDVAKIVSILKTKRRGSSGTTFSKAGRWRSFSQHPRDASTTTEATYAPWEDMVEAVKETCKDAGPPTFDFELRGRSGGSRSREIGLLPDAYFVLRREHADGDVAFHRRVAVAGALEKDWRYESEKKVNRGRKSYRDLMLILQPAF